MLIRNFQCALHASQDFHHDATTQRPGQQALFIFGPAQLRDLDQFNVCLLGHQQRLVLGVKI